MTIQIVGLGLMGGSLAMALRGFENAALWGVDTDPAAREAALRSGAVDAVYDEPAVGADVTIYCLPPEATVAVAERYAGRNAPGSLFCELCGVKADIVPKIASLLPPGVDYIPLHPMAGKETGGYAAADGRMFIGAGLVVTMPDGGKPRRASLIERTARYIGFGEVVYTTPERHDALIAYTSHLPHVAASALCLNMPEGLTLPFAGGSFRDGTRVADIDAALWAVLLLENRENLLSEIDRLQSSLGEFRKAVDSGCESSLTALLTKAKENKRSL